MKRSRLPFATALAAFLAAALLSGALVRPAMDAPAEPTPDPAKPVARSACERGVILARGGELAAAESLFVAALSAPSQTACALANLGNVAVLRGNNALALAFYDQSMLADSVDAGTRLDRALVLSLLGQSDESDREMNAAVQLAGSVEAAEALLGLRREPESGEAEAAKRPAASGSRFTSEEIRRMLRASLSKLPPGKTPGGGPVRPRPEDHRRTAGPRADDIRASGSLLYWKR